ncbi:MAG: hypothetical protein WBK91_03490 [Alphaproteobacteria bacterium]
MIQAQQKPHKNRLAYAATAAIMFSGTMLSPHVGVAAASERDNFIKATIEVCEKKNAEGESDARGKKLGLYATTGAIDLFGGTSGLASLAAVIVDAVFDITGFTPTDCKLTAEVEAFKRKWPDTTQSESVAPPGRAAPEQVFVPEGAAPLVVAGLTEVDRAFVQEFKSAMVLRGKALTRKSHKSGRDLGAPHRELVQFMDSVGNDQWNATNREKLQARLELISVEDKMVGSEAKRIARKVAADFSPGGSKTARKSPVYDPREVLDVLSQPVPERHNAPPSQPVLDTRPEMG